MILKLMLVCQDSAGIVKLESLLTNNMQDWVEMCKKAIRDMGGHANSPPPLSELGLTPPETPTHEQSRIMSILDIVQDEDRREHSAMFEKILGNLRDVAFAIQWITVASTCI